MDGKELENKIEKAPEQPGITLLKTSSEDYQAVNMAIMRSLVTDHDLPGIYVTVNKPYGTITNVLEENDIDASKIFFIDAISEDLNEEPPERRKNVMFVDSPKNLTDISIILSEAIDNMPEDEKFVFFDSMSVLTIYNDKEAVTKFAHYLTGKMRTWNVAGVIISVEDEMEHDVLTHLTQLCDNVIDV